MPDSAHLGGGTSATSVMTRASDADVERSLLEAGSYWSTMQHLLAIMSGRKSSMSVLHWLPGELLTNIARLAIRGSLSLGTAA